MMKKVALFYYICYYIYNITIPKANERIPQMQSKEELSDLWALALTRMEKDYSKTTVNLWFSEMIPLEINDERAVFALESDLKRTIVENKYKGYISGILKDLMGFHVEVFITDGKSASFSAPTPQQNTEQAGNNEKPEMAEKKGGGRSGGLFFKSNDYTFENFIVGSSNTFAHAACGAVVNKPAEAYNPLFIYGPSGLGKTHLMYAIKNEMVRKYPDAQIIYKKGEDFTNELVGAISEGTTPLFREKYRSADVLIIDDIQFIAGKKATQEEFFHTFDFLAEHDKQIILTSDRQPKEIPDLVDRLRTRFESGLMADIQPPDIELRMAIIKHKARAMNINIPNDVITYMADRLDENIRQIEGALKKIVALSFLTGTSVTVDIARNAIADLLSDTEPVNVTTEKIFRVVSRKYSVSAEDVKSNKRTSEISMARHICCYLFRSLTGLSYNAIGKLINRNYATAICSVQKIEKDISENANFDTEIRELVSEVRGS